MKSPLQSWDMEKGTKLRSFAGHQGEINSVAVAPNGATALSGGDDATLRLWELSSEHPLRTFSDPTMTKVLAIAIAPSGRTALSGSADGAARLWQIATGNVLRTFKGHTDTVDAVAIAPDGRTAVTGSRDKTLKLWT